ncbi:MAG TPA: HD-GYP domain-containing protein, partial [Streptosporangiaceae bacterium]|nr:HD-GYP domain-containing protein [Streptosporangiaceae bacterium]
GGEDMGRLSLTTWLYIAAVVSAAVAVLAHVPVGAAPAGFWVICATLALLFLVCDSTPIVLGARQWAWSPSSAATLAAVVLLGHRGGIGAAMVGAVAVVSVHRRVQLVERLFNGAMYALAGYAAGLTFQALHGQSFIRPDHLQPDYLHLVLFGEHLTPRVTSSFEMSLQPFAVAAIVHVLVNHGLLWGMLLLDRHSRATTRQAAPWGLPLLLAADVGLAALGLVIAALWAVFGPFAPAIVLVPLYVARWAMGQFAEQQRAHAATLRALCQAVETKDFYTRGHSERVSRGAGMIARQIGMRSDRAEAVRFAGMLHDVGKLGVPTRVLQKEGKLTEEEFAAIQLHPMRGLEIVREIGFLNEALTGIMHHHERMDGRGYPMGFAGHEIPEFARIIAVADAFDSMTSTRAYRKATRISDAIAELRRGAGTQFDPKFVDAFVTALDQDGWELQEPAQPRSHEILTSQDHDDPIAPLRVVETI